MKRNAPSKRAAAPEEMSMLPSASFFGVIAGILTVAAVAVHLLVDAAFRLAGG